MFSNIFKYLKKTKHVLFLTILSQTLILTAQESSLNLKQKEIDFGRIASISYPPKVLEFTNTGKSKLAILLIEKGPNVRVKFDAKFYQPGENGTLLVYYDVRELGEIREEIKIFTNLDNEPIAVTLKGTCISVQECFPNINNLNLRNIAVINKNSQKPVPNAVVTFIRNHNAKNPVSFTMDKMGKAVEEVPIGLYNIKAEIPGFENYNNEIFIPKTQPLILVELVPKQEVPEVPVAVTKVQQDSTMHSEIAVTSADLPENKYAANNIVLLLDVSSSMRSQGKFSLLQQSINNLALILRPIDYVTIVTYASAPRLVLPTIPGNEKEKIISCVQDMIPSGSTQGVKGLNMAYELALKQYIGSGNNQVILATDGEFSEKGLTDEYYQQYISNFAKQGVKLSILGFGVNQNAIARMKKMSDAGNGSFIQVPSEEFVKDLLIKEVKSMSFIKAAGVQ